MRSASAASRKGTECSLVIVSLDRDTVVVPTASPPGGVSVDGDPPALSSCSRSRAYSRSRCGRRRRSILRHSVLASADRRHGGQMRSHK